MTQLWKLNGYCPECNRSYVVMESEKINTIAKYHEYYSKMINNNRPTLQCKECGAHFESVIIKAVYTRPEKRLKGIN